MSISLGSRAICGGVYNRHMGQPDGIGSAICNYNIHCQTYRFLYIQEHAYTPPGPQEEGAVVASPKAHNTPKTLPCTPIRVPY